MSDTLSIIEAEMLLRWVGMKNVLKYFLVSRSNRRAYAARLSELMQMEKKHQFDALPDTMPHDERIARANYEAAMRHGEHCAQALSEML